MFKRKRKVLTIVMSLLMAVSVIPGAVFADDNENTVPSVRITNAVDQNGVLEVAVGTKTEISADISGEKGKSYHVHWTAEGSKGNCNFSSDKPKKLTVEAKTAYETGKATTITAYLYEGEKCEGYYCEKTPSCGINESYAAVSEPIKFRAVEGEIAEKFNPLKIKVNGTLIEENTVVPIERWEVSELEAGVDGADYNYEWEKKDGIEVINYIDAAGDELRNDVASIKGNPIKVKGLVVQQGTMTVKAYNKKGEEKGSVQFTIRVNSDMEYGAQGAVAEGYKDPQTIEIVKINDKIVTDEAIEVKKAIKEPDDTFINTIKEPFAGGKKVNITFFVGKQMSLSNFASNEEFFRNTTLSYIYILDKDGKRISELKPIQLIGQNIDRSVTVSLPVDQLKAGEYMIVFDKGLTVRNNGQPLAANVQFNFAVQGSSDNTAEDPADNPDTDVINGASDMTDNDGADAARSGDAAKTGDSMSIALYAAVMFAALCGCVVAFTRRKKEQ